MVVVVQNVSIGFAYNLYRLVSLTICINVRCGRWRCAATCFIIENLRYRGLKDVWIEVELGITGRISKNLNKHQTQTGCIFLPAQTGCFFFVSSNGLYFFCQVKLTT